MKLVSTSLLAILTAFAVGITADAAQAAVFYPTSFTLDNGLQVVVVPNHLAPAVNQMVWYKVGSVDEVQPKRGLAHYLEHLMFRGTKDVAPGDFSKIIARQGGEDNAFTSYDYTSYHETVAADRLQMIMQMEADRMHNLQITAETATPELNVVLDERQQRTDNNPQGRFNEKLRNLLLPDHPYGVPVIGWKKEIEGLTAVDAQAFYKKYYAPNNAVVVISGDVDPDNVRQLAQATFGPLPRTENLRARPVAPTTLPKTKRFEMKDAGIDQPEIVFEVVIPSYATQKKTEAYAYEVLAEALDGGEIGPLYQALVVGRQSASGVETEYDPDARGDAIFAVGLSPQPGKKAEQLEKDFHNVLKVLASKGLDAATVEGAKTRMQRSAIFARDNLMGSGYAFGMALTTGHTVDDVEQWPDRIAQVSVDQVNQALRDLVANPHNITGLLLPDEHATAAQREAAHSTLSHDMGIR